MSSNLRQRIFNDPEGALVERWGAPDHVPARIQQQMQQWQHNRDQIRQLRERKQLCSREFGAARQRGDDLQPFKKAMQAVSSELKSLETRQRDLETELLEHWQTTDASRPAERPVLPERLSTAEPQGPAAGITVSGYTAKDREEWDRYVDAHPRASLYHRTIWREVIGRSLGQADASLLARNESGQLAGILPLVRLKSRLFGDFAVSMPYFNYGGPLSDHSGVSDALLEAAGQWAEREALDHLEIRELAPRSGWPERSHKLSMIRRLPNSAEELDRELGSKLRAQIRRAERENPRVRIGGSELLPDFYRVFARNMRDLGTPVYSDRFFAEVLAAWPQSRIVCVYLEGRAVAAALLLGYRETLEIPWASTLRETNALGINMLMYWQVLNLAIEQGYHYFDFGRSSPDSGTYRFKRQWGAEPVPHHWHYWLPAGESLPELNPNNPKFRLLIAVWQRLPVALTRWLGPPIVRNLP